RHQTSEEARPSDAWQFMAGVLPATLRAVAAQRVLTDRLQIKQKAQSFD
ncbi:hypothetical protein L246_25315, partial [Salmonella enterica subsp. enterica serovar Worthington str. BCH-5715]